jgi:hypothetical protein
MVGCRRLSVCLVTPMQRNALLLSAVVRIRTALKCHPPYSLQPFTFLTLFQACFQVFSSSTSDSSAWALTCYASLIVLGRMSEACCLLPTASLTVPHTYICPLYHYTNRARGSRPDVVFGSGGVSIVNDTLLVLVELFSCTMEETRDADWTALRPCRVARMS